MSKPVFSTIALLTAGFVAMGYYVYKDFQVIGKADTAEVTPMEFDPDPSVSHTELPLPEDDEAVFNYLDNPMSFADNPQVPALTVGNHGYLQYEMRCMAEGTAANGGPDLIKCQTPDNGTIIDAQFLSLLPPVLNVDLLRPDFECTMLCIDAEGYPVGSAQVEMFQWREKYCVRSAEFGTWECKVQK